MAEKSGPPPIVYILLALALVGGFFFLRKPTLSMKTASSDLPQAPESVPAKDSTFASPTAVPSGTTVRIDGSTSMVQINQILKRGFEAQFPGTTVVANATGSDHGIQALLAGTVDIAASSRPLTTQEQNQGLAMMPLATDAIAVVIGSANPLQQGLTRDQVVGIFQGQITDWSMLGGPGGTIRVINRPPVSGTYRIFQELVLAKGDFGCSPNITTLQRDATTPLLQALKSDGIGYATYSQVANQNTVRTVAIDGLTPEMQNYPYKRTLYYIYKKPPSASVQAFLSYATSAPGKQTLSFTAVR